MSAPLDAAAFEVIMILVIGGAGQGKLSFVQKSDEKNSLGAHLTADERLRYLNLPLLDGAVDEMPRCGGVIFNHFHLFFRRHMQSEKETDIVSAQNTCADYNFMRPPALEPLSAARDRREKETNKFVSYKCVPYTIIISDEVGCGIVPIDKGERQFRERLGRCLTDIASRSDMVFRVFCGIAQRIK